MGQSTKAHCFFLDGRRLLVYLQQYSPYKKVVFKLQLSLFQSEKCVVSESIGRN